MATVVRKIPLMGSPPEVFEFGNMAPTWEYIHSDMIEDRGSHNVTAMFFPAWMKDVYGPGCAADPALQCHRL